MMNIRRKTPPLWAKNQKKPKKIFHFFPKFLVFWPPLRCLTADMHHYGTDCSLGGPLPNPKKIFKIRPSSKKLDLKFEKKCHFFRFFDLGSAMMGAMGSILVPNDRSSRDLSSPSISSLYLEGPRFFGQKTQKFSRFLAIFDMSRPRNPDLKKIWKNFWWGNFQFPTRW